MKVFEKSNYRQVIREAIEEAKQKLIITSLAEVAKRCQMQPSYLSNVLKERAHFSQDQVYDIMSLLGYNSDETAYVLLLLEMAKCGSVKRKAYLKKEIQKIKYQFLRADHYLDAEIKDASDTATANANYYLDPMAMVLHMYYGIENAIQDPQHISERFHISHERVLSITRLLLQNQFLEKNKGRFRALNPQLHLSKDSPLDKSNQILTRSLSQERIFNLDNTQKFGFSVTFTANELAKDQIKIEFLNFIKKCQTIASSSPADSVWQMNFDLFPWHS